MSDNAGLDSIISENVNTYLTDPSNFPQEFLDWLPQFLTTNAPTLTNQDLTGGTITPADGNAHSVAWGQGTLSFAGTTASDSQQHGLGDTPQFVVAFPAASGVILGGTADDSNVNINGLLPASETLSVPYFWLAIV